MPFASQADAHTRGVLAFIGECCVGICDSPAVVVVPGRVWPGLTVRTRDLAYCEQHRPEGRRQS